MSIREQILDAAEDVLRARGLARATTKEIARVAGCSEGSLYNHFDNKETLYLAVISERLPEFATLVMALEERAGTRSVRGILEEVVGAAVTFYAESVPMTAAVFATRELLDRHRDGLRSRGAGPHRPLEGLAAYLRREQLLGRIAPDASAEAAAALLLGACHQRGFHAHFLDDAALGTDEHFIQELVATLLQGLEPR